MTKRAGPDPDPDPDLLIKCTDPWIQIRTKMSRIGTTASEYAVIAVHIIPATTEKGFQE